MKTYEEIEQYQRLENKMISKCESNNQSWARYYASLLSLGGQNSEQYLRNFFTNDDKRFNPQQLAVIYNDLEEFKYIEVITQDEMEKEVLAFTRGMGDLANKMNDCFDKDNEMSKKEAKFLIKSSRAIAYSSNKLLLRLLETKAQG